MASDKLSKEQIEEITNALDRVVEDLPWGQSVFLSALGKKFEKIRDEFKNDVQGILIDSKESHQHGHDHLTLRDDHIEIYIGIYNAQGTKLNIWTKVILNLIAQCVSRPIYATESAVKEMVRSKSNLNNEGYVLIHVKETDLMKVDEDKIPRDKLGNELLLLKDRVITPEKIKKFFHSTGEYEYKHGVLTRIGNMSFSENN